MSELQDLLQSQLDEREEADNTLQEASALHAKAKALTEALLDLTYPHQPPSEVVAMADHLEAELFRRKESAQWVAKHWRSAVEMTRKDISDSAGA